MHPRKPQQLDTDKELRVEQSGNCPFCLSVPKAGMGTAELPLEWSWWVEKAPACSALLCFVSFAVEHGTLQIIHGSSGLPRAAGARYSHRREFGHGMNFSETLEEYLPQKCSSVSVRRVILAAWPIISKDNFKI